MDDDNCTGVWRENMMLRGITKTAKKLVLSRKNPHLVNGKVLVPPRLDFF